MLADDPSPCYYRCNSLTSLFLLLSFNSSLSTNHGGLMPHVQHEPVEDLALPSYSGIQVIRSSVISTHASKLTSAEKERIGGGGGLGGLPLTTRCFGLEVTHSASIHSNRQITRAIRLPGSRALQPPYV